MKPTNGELDALIEIIQSNSNIAKRWEALKIHPINKRLGLTKEQFLAKQGARNQSMEGRIREYLSYDLSRPVSFSHDELRKWLDSSSDQEYDQAIFGRNSAENDTSTEVHSSFIGNAIIISVIGLMLGIVYFVFAYQVTTGSTGTIYLVIFGYLLLGIINLMEMIREDGRWPDGAEQLMIPVVIVLWLPMITFLDAASSAVSKKKTGNWSAILCGVCFGYYLFVVTFGGSDEVVSKREQISMISDTNYEQKALTSYELYKLTGKLLDDRRWRYFSSKWRSQQEEGMAYSSPIERDLHLEVLSIAREEYQRNYNLYLELNYVAKDQKYSELVNEYRELEEESDRLNSYRVPLDSCIASINYEGSCSADPVFTFCGITEDNVLGSGCTARIENAGGFAEQVDYCIAKVAPVIRQQCAIEVFGCAAATGNVNC